MKIVVIGTRGIPNISGGIETHCEELYPRLAAKGHDITVMRRSCYVNDSNRVNHFRGVNIIDLRTPKRKSFENIIHTFRSILKARKLKPDIVHVHAIGPGLLVPMARIMGLKVVLTDHGPDYDREKWGRIAKTMLRCGERLGTNHSNRVIVISKTIRAHLKEKYGRDDLDLIFNGVNYPVKSEKTDYIESLGLQPGKYIVAVGRFVKEKGFHDLIDAFAKLKPEGYKLAIAGDSDHRDHYYHNLKKMGDDAGVVFTGFIKGENLNQLMSWARLFAIPSYHEGLPIALLEAMSYDLDVVASDIPANLLPQLTPADHFPVGDIDRLAEILGHKLAEPYAPRHYDLSDYDWDTIADKTEAVYHRALGIDAPDKS